MSSTPNTTMFHFEMNETRDQHNLRVTTITCHGRLVGETSAKLREAVHPLIEGGGTVIIDCGDVSFLDSRGLGALVGLKVSSINKGMNTLKLVNLSQRVKDLLRLTKLDQFLTY